MDFGKNYIGESETQFEVRTQCMLYGCKALKVADFSNHAYSTAPGCKSLLEHLPENK